MGDANSSEQFLLSPALAELSLDQPSLPGVGGVLADGPTITQSQIDEYQAAVGARLAVGDTIPDGRAFLHPGHRRAARGQVRESAAFHSRPLAERPGSNDDQEWCSTPMTADPFQTTLNSQGDPTAEVVNTLPAGGCLNLALYGELRKIIPVELLDPTEASERHVVARFLGEPRKGDFRWLLEFDSFAEDQYMELACDCNDNEFAAGVSEIC